MSSGTSTAGAALGASGSLRLLRREAIARQLFTCYEQGRTPALEPSSPVGDDSDVMQREITTIPAVIRDRLGLASQAAATAEGLRGRGIEHLVLVGCGGPDFVGDLKPAEPAVHLPLAAGVSEELTPVLASIPLSQIGLHLMRLNGRRSYNFPDEAAAREHYDTIHRVSIGEPA